MSPQDLIAALAGFFMAVMIWLRTRTHYAQRAQGPLQLPQAGRVYFAAVVALLLLGWFAAPPLGRSLWPSVHAGSTLLRVLWYLVTYYVFLAVHNVLRRRDIAVFEPRSSG